jgi:phosphatidylglycerol---prolipoprotein diacylglyceryl transferase
MVEELRANKQSTLSSILPFSPKIFGYSVNIHLFLEYLAFFVAYRYYSHLRKNRYDPISPGNRLSIILGAAVGALIGSRLIGLLENPAGLTANTNWLLQLYTVKTIMGGLFGGLLGVEITKGIIGEENSSGDLLTLPIIVGLFIGRIGCFLIGTNEFTYGIETSAFTGMDLGDGIQRHPIALYELLFLAILFALLKRLYDENILQSGYLFRFFMLAYFGFRFMIEFIKPNVFFLMGLSTIQWLCILCFVYYRKTIITAIRAHEKIHIL